LRKVEITARDPREGRATGTRKRETCRHGSKLDGNNSPGQDPSAQNATATIRQDKTPPPGMETRSKQTRPQMPRQYLQGWKIPAQKKGRAYARPIAADPQLLPPTRPENIPQPARPNSTQHSPQNGRRYINC